MSAASRTDESWELFGRTDPYWAVVTAEQFHKDRLTDEAVREFFATGERYVDSLFETVRAQLDAAFRPRAVLDFGCGVGRLLVPLARSCDRAVGVDVAESMLAQAQERCAAVGLDWVELVRGDDELSLVDGPFDLVHSSLVLQHIPPERGMRLVRRLVELLEDGGVGVLHMTYAVPRRRWWRRWLSAVKAFVLHLLGLIGPRMFMFEYDLNAVLRILQEAGVRRLHVDFTDHGGCYGAILFFQKKAGESYRA